MQIPIRATFRRAEKPGGRATFESAVFAEIPDELVIGTAAQVAVDVAMRAGDDDAVSRLSRAIELAETDGKIMTMK